MPEDDKKDQSQNPDTNAEMDAVDPNFKIPSLDDIEYATPSAYIDPDLPANPTPIEDPTEPQEEEPKEEPETIEMTPDRIAEAIKASNEVMSSVAEKIANSRNILVALSSDPSVDELSAAISLSLFLDRLGKHAVAVYSGAAPNALQFLKPEDVFEKNADVMQDFVIALDKEKADHLRYKLDGEDVKIFITPYKDRIASEDLSFSYGDYNIDLVLSLNVNNGIDLDPALSEYGTIMRDASVVNVTTGNPGKFGEVEWSNKFSSSVSEMIANLLLNAEGDTKIDAEEATALLTGIVAATDRFSRANTTSSTMQTASRLMDAGANQQLVAANISDNLDNQFFSFSDSHIKNDADSNNIIADTDDVSISFKSTKEPKTEIPDDGTSLQISHKPEEESEEEPQEESSKKPSDESSEEPSEKPSKEVESSTPEEPTSEEKSPEENIPTENREEEKPAESDASLLDELKATEASLSGVGAETVKEPGSTPQDLATAVSAAESAAPSTAPSVAPTVAPETVITPAAPTESFADATSKYSQMLTDALKEPTPTTNDTNMASSLPPITNPATINTPEVATPEVSGVPDINYGQTTGDILPPPPAPPIDVTAPMPIPAPSSMPPTNTSPAEPAPSTTPDASAFTIPNI